MSADDDEAASCSCCASCGIAENDDIKLKKCTACYLVRYCSVICQRDHWPKHKRACKKRAAELKDELLFKQPESSYFGDCPICCLPLYPLDRTQADILEWGCCSKIVCNGCAYANNIRELEARLQRKCPFCRTPLPESQAELDRNVRKRMEANDPVALRVFGTKRYGKGDYDGALEYWTRAAKLGDVEAHHQLSVMYRDGLGVAKDKKKEVYHTEQAAIGGYPAAIYNLGANEIENGRYERAVKHFTIAVNLGCDDSLGALKQCYQRGIISKDDFAAALRAHKAAVDATKSPQRAVAVGKFNTTFTFN